MSETKTNVKAEKEVEKTLRLLDSVPSQAPPFFYTRLKTRMESQAAPRWEQRILRQVRPVLAVAAATVLVLVNLYCVYKASEETAEAQRQQAAASIAEDYEFTSSQY
jgi:hypothetical protein